MPNHFHLLIKQITRDGISKLLKQVMNGYTLYFNEKYERLGSLIQGSFRAVEIINDDLLLHVFRYIHLNPAVSGIVKKPVEYRWSSYSFYLQGKESICKKDLFLSYFPSLTKLREFTEDQIDYAKQLDKIKHLTIE
jgi:putative transposase